MKKSIFSRIHGGIFLLLLTILAIQMSCSKESNNELVVSSPTTQSKPPEQSAKQDEATHKSMVKTAAIGLLELSKQVSFRTTVNAAVALKFDKDNNALLKKINADLLLSGQTGLSSQFSSSIASNHTALEAKEVAGNLRLKDYLAYTDLTNIGKTIEGYQTWGNTAYLQIYIPFSESVNLLKQPVIALADSETSDCQISAYQLDANGIWQAITIDETFAQNNLVWVVSANERIDDNAAVESLTIQGNPEEQVDGGVTSRANENYACNTKTIEVWDRKECWYCGEADASIVGAAIRTSNCSNIFRFHEKNFKNISRFEIGDVINASRKLIEPEDLVKVDFKMGFVWYEKDWVNWQTSTMTTCGTEFSFKSKDSPWAVQNYTILWSEPLANDGVWHDSAFSYPSAVNQPNSNIITFWWQKTTQ
jgi:hypothetical protein